MPVSPETVAELYWLLKEGDAYQSVIERVKKIEREQQRLGAVVHVSFDLPVLKWGAAVSVYIDGHVFRVDFHSGVTASAIIDRVVEAFDAKFWTTSLREIKNRCPKCGNTGVECYDDPADREAHLRPCDCPIGRAKNAEHVAGAAAPPLRPDMGEAPVMERRVLYLLATCPVWMTHDAIWRGLGSPKDPESGQLDFALIALRKRGSVEVDTNGSTLRYRRLSP